MTTMTADSKQAPVGQVEPVEPAQLRQWMDEGSATVIDVREPDEHYVSRIPGARLVPLSRLTPADAPAEGRVVLYCQTGIRSGEAASRLARSGRSQVYHLKGGFKAWRASGQSIIRDRAVSISVQRQVQMTIGAVVLVTVLLAALVSPWFLLITGFMGAGLLFAGATGTCALASLIRAMPWNRVRPSC